MPTAAAPHRPRRRGAAIVACSIVAVAMLVGVLLPMGARRAGAATSPDVELVASYLATLVRPDGSVLDPWAIPAAPSVTATVDVALALAKAGSQPEALGRTLAYIEANVDAYVTEVGTNTTGRFAYLIMLAVATGHDPRAYGGSRVDLVAGLRDRYSTEEPGLYGPVNPYASVMIHSLALLAMHAAGEPVPADAIAWLVDQQCDTANNSLGGWQAYRAPAGGGRAPCGVSSGTSYEGADANSTGFALQALARLGATGGFASAGAWLTSLQASAATPTGGFGQYVGDDADPNSTALIIQALVAMGDDPLAARWTPASSTPLQSLSSWIVRSGPETGAVSSPWSSGYSDFFATYQALWGLALQPFPLVPVLVIDPPTTGPVTDPTPFEVAPSFTG